VEEILVHTYDDEPCDRGLDPHEDNICLHGWRAHHVYRQVAA
jgi:hypothetical protein